MALALIGVGCASPGSPDPAPESDARAPRLLELHWLGVESVPVAELQRVVRVGTPSAWVPWERTRLPDESLLRADCERISALYRKRGYYGAEVDYETRPLNDDGVLLSFRVREGAPVILHALRIDLRDPDGAAVDASRRMELMEDVALTPGEIFDVERYRAARDQLLQRLAESGHLAASIEGGATVDPAAHTAEIDWKLSIGPRVLQGAVEIEGLDRVDETLVRQTLESESGAVLTGPWLERGEQRLLELGLFRWATVQAVPPDANSSSRQQTWAIAVHVAERPPRSVELSLGYATDEQVRAGARWEHRNLLGRGRILRAGARASSLSQSADAGIEWRDLFVPDLHGGLSATLRSESLDAYDALELELRSQLQRALAKRWTGRIGHRFELTDTSEISETTNQVIDDANRISALLAEIEGTTVDDPADPHSGFSVELGAQLSARALGSELDFVRGDLDLRGYRSWRSTVFAARLQVGAIVPLGSTVEDDVPLTERYYAGGGESVRGFDFQRLGPLDAENEPIGGTGLIVANLEWRVPLYRRLGGVLFLDAGRIFDPGRIDDGGPATRPLRASDAMRYSAGVGLRLSTPIGPVRVDYGYRLNERAGNEDTGRFHISVGHAF